MGKGGNEKKLFSFLLNNSTLCHTCLNIFKTALTIKTKETLILLATIKSRSSYTINIGGHHQILAGE
jgi:hypothetical protein